MESATNPNAIAQEQVDATNAQSDAQMQMEHAFQVSAKANTEAREVAQRMVNLTNLHDKALEDARLAMEGMNEKLQKTQAEADEAKEQAREAEERADTLEATATTSETMQASGEDAEEQAVEKEAVEAGSLEQAKIDLDTAKENEEAAEQTAEKVSEDVAAQQTTAQQMQQQDTNALTEAQTGLENAQVATAQSQLTIQQQQEVARVADIVKTATVVTYADTLTNSSTPIDVTSADEMWRQRQAAANLSPDLVPNMVKQGNNSLALQQQVAATQEATAQDEQQEDAVNAARDSAVTAEEAVSNQALAAANAIQMQDDGSPADSLKTAQLYAAVKTVQDATQNSLQTKNNLNQQQDVLLAHGSGSGSAAASSNQTTRWKEELSGMEEMGSWADLEEELVTLDLR